VIEKGTIEVFILAGGESRRMGTDKGLVNFKGMPMILHILKILDKLHLPTSIISSNQEYLKFGKPVHKDVIPDKGPLGGLYTALETSNSSMVILLACDMPSINSEGIQSLLALAETGKITVATDAMQISPFFACYPTSLKKEVEKTILRNELKMLDFVLKQSYTLLDLRIGGNALVLQNLNTKEELLSAQIHKKQRN
tara:strand:- start:642 stop:1232 length:591 start_codon:yes stop_codon:yes gene_type:complete